MLCVFQINRKPAASVVGGRVGFPAKNFPIEPISIPSKAHSFHSVHSAIGRMNGTIFRSFRKRNRSQKNTNTVYSEYSYSGIVPKERACSYSYIWQTYTQTKRNNKIINKNNLKNRSLYSRIIKTIVHVYDHTMLLPLRYDSRNTRVMSRMLWRTTPQCVAKVVKTTCSI